MSGLGLLFSRRGIMMHSAEGYPAEIDNSLVPLYFEALEDMTVSFSVNAIQYSLDNDSWNDLPVGTATPLITSGSKIYFKASGLSAASGKGIGTFSSTGIFNVGGNIMSLKYGDEFLDKEPAVSDYQFQALFSKNTRLVSAHRLVLPAMTMNKNSYSRMFDGCTLLTTAPELPATTLSDYCYASMFSGCSSLIYAPSNLPATIILNGSYSEMFRGCKSMEIAPDILATTISGSFYTNANIFYECSKLRYIKAMILTNPSRYFVNWVYKVASEGVFVKNVAATWNVVGDSGVPTGWTIEYAES